MTHSFRARKRRLASNLSYEAFEPRNMLATISVGDLNSGVAVSEDATGVGYILYSQEEVHTRFSGIRTDNADHFIAARLDGIQWQYNNDSQWVDFETELTDVLVAEVNFDGDAVVRQNQVFVQGVLGLVPDSSDGLTGESFNAEGDLYVVANQFGSQYDNNEFQVLGSQFETVDFPDDVDFREANLFQIQSAARLSDFGNGNRDFFELANFDNEGNPLLSWRVHLLPYLGYDNLYQQFNLDEPWNSPHNLAIADQMPDIYSSPNFESSNRTPYLASAGEDSVFKLDDSPNDVNGENALAFVEVDASHAVVWTQPVDWYFNQADPFAGLGNASEDGFLIASTNGGPFQATDQIDPVNFRNYVTTSAGGLVDYSEFDVPFSSRVSLNQLAFAALNFQSANQHFPAQSIKADDGTPLLSWRVALLPFLGENELYQQFNLDEAWDSPHNIQLLDNIPYWLQHADVEHGKTVYLGLDGQGTVFDSQRTREIGLGQIADGSTNTILFVEADVSQAVEWSRPVDLNYDAANPTSGLGGTSDDGTSNAVLTDARVVSFDSSVPQLLDAWTTYNGGEVNDETILADGFSRFRSVENQLRQITLATLNFERSHAELPRTIYSTDNENSDEGPGVPLLSWRVAILPFIEQQNLYDQFRLDEPWDSPHNLSLLPLMPQIFATEGVENGKTVFQGAHGDNTLFSNVNDGRQLFLFDRHDTAAVLQVNPDQAIEWTKPGDFDFDPDNLDAILGAATASGFHFSLNDGSVHFFNNTISDDVLNKILSPADFTDLAVDLKVFREDSRSTFSSAIEQQGKLSELSWAAQNYESGLGHFPQHAIYSQRPGEGGEPLLSWRVELLPFLGEQELYDRFNLDEPWDSPHNLSLLPLMPEVFKLPGVENGKTAFQAITSEFNSPGDLRTVFPLGNDVTTGFFDIQDGSINTLLFAEVDAAFAVEWTKPQDIVYNPDDPTAGLNTGTSFVSTNIALVGGSTVFVPGNLKEDVWRELILINDGGLADLSSPSSFNSGTIVPAGEFGTQGGDTFSLVLVGDTVEISVNGDIQTLNVADIDHMVFNGLGGTDTFTFDIPDGTDLRIINGAYQVGDLFTVVVDNIDELLLENGTLSIPGDVDLNGAVNFFDLAPFISLLTSGDYQIEADANQDGFVNFFDIAPLIDILAGAANTSNVSPVLESIPDQNVDEHSELSFHVVGTDADSSQSLSYDLIGNVPEGAAIDSNTGLLTWTPGESFGGSAVSITVRVTDDGEGELSDTQTFNVTVDEVDNLAPEIVAALGTVLEGGSLQLTQFNLEATDGDSIETDLEFVLESLPQSGQFFLGGSALAQFDSFTQQDVISGLVQYVHDGSNTVADSAGFVARDLAGNESSSLTFEIAVVDETIGDLNLDGDVDFFDISPFISSLTDGVFRDEADINQDGEVDFFDIAFFIDLLSRQ